MIFTNMTFITCERDFNPFNTSQNVQGTIQLIKRTDCSGQLNTYFYNGNITVDILGQIWYSTSFCDTSVEIPPESNIYCKGLWKICKFDGKNYCTIFDSLNYEINEIQLDINGTMWIINSKQIIKIDTQNRLSICYDNSNNDGLFNSLAIDNNNIWVGGLNTGLFKITDSQIIQYTSTNSTLPTNSITKILVDENNTKWIALWDLQGLIKIENNNWTHYNSTNSNITQQNIWDLAKDSNGNSLANKNVELCYVREDGYVAKDAQTTDENGILVWGVISKIAGEATLTAVADGVELSQHPVLLFVND